MMFATMLRTCARIGGVHRMCIRRTFPHRLVSSVATTQWAVRTTQDAKFGQGKMLVEQLPPQSETQSEKILSYWHDVPLFASSYGDFSSLHYVNEIPQG
jgi:hypothetical protein